MKDAVVDERIAALTKRVPALRTLQIERILADRLETAVAMPTRQRTSRCSQITLGFVPTLDKVVGRNQVVVGPRQVGVVQEQQRAHGTLDWQFAHIAVAVRTLVVPIAETQMATTDVRQLRFTLPDGHHIALLLQHRKTHAVQIAHLPLHRGRGFGGLHTVHQGRLDLLLQKVLDLLGRDGHAEGTGGKRAELLVHEHLAGEAEYGTLNVLGMSSALMTHLLLNMFKGGEDVARIEGVKRRHHTHDLLRVLEIGHPHRVHRHLQRRLEAETAAALQIVQHAQMVGRVLG